MQNQWLPLNIIFNRAFIFICTGPFCNFAYLTAFTPLTDMYPILCFTVYHCLLCLSKHFVLRRHLQTWQRIFINLNKVFTCHWFLFLKVLYKLLLFLLLSLSVCIKSTCWRSEITADQIQRIKWQQWTYWRSEADSLYLYEWIFIIISLRTVKHFWQGPDLYGIFGADANMDIRE